MNKLVLLAVVIPAVMLCGCEEPVIVADDALAKPAAQPADNARASVGQVREITASGSPVHSIAMSPDGKILFVGRAGGTLESFESKTGRKICSFAGHTGCLAVSPDGKMLASGAQTVQLWNPATGKEIRTFDEIDRGITSLAFTPDGKKLLAGAGSEFDHAVLLLDVQTGKQEHIYQGDDIGPIVQVALSKDGKYILAGTTRGGQVIIWDRQTEELASRINFENYTVAISPDQSHVLSGCSPWALSGIGGADLEISDITTGNVIRTISPDNNSRWEKVESIAFSADGKRFVSGVREGTVRIWDSETGDMMHTMRLEATVSAVLFSPDGRTVVAGCEDGKVVVWSPTPRRATARPLIAKPVEVEDAKATSGTVREFAAFRSPVWRMAMSPDGKTLFVGWGWDNLESYEFKTGKKLNSFKGHTEDVLCLAVSPDGKTLASGSFQTLKIWDVTTGWKDRTLDDHVSRPQALAFTPDGNKLLVAEAGYDAGSIVAMVDILDVKTGEKESFWSGGGHTVDVALSKDGKNVLATNDCGGFYDWDRKAPREPGGCRYFEVAVGKQEQDFKNPGVISHDKSRVLFAHAADAAIADVATGKTIRTFNPGKDAREYIMALAFSPDGRRFASGGFIYGGSEGFVRIWDIETGNLLDTLRLEGAVQAVLFTPDGRQIVAGGEGNKAIVWTPAAIAPATQPAVMEPVLKDLGRMLAIREQAATLPELVARARPDFAFGENGRDMMWISADAEGKPSFRMERPYIYSPPGHEVSFVLLKLLNNAVPIGSMDAYEQVFISGRPAMAKLYDQRPVHDGGSGEYAVVKSSGPDGAELFEIGWQSGYGTNWSKERRLFVLRSGGRWQFVGEGPSEGYDKMGYGQGRDTAVDSRVEWTGRKDAPVRLRFTVTDADRQWAGSDDLQANPAAGDSLRDDLESRTDWVLDGGLPGTLRKVSDRPYMLARHEDSLDKIVRLLASWWRDFGDESDSQKFQAVLRNELIRLNPGLLTGDIREGYRIKLPANSGLTEFSVPGDSSTATQPAAEKSTNR